MPTLVLALLLLACAAILTGAGCRAVLGIEDTTDDLCDPAVETCPPDPILCTPAENTCGPSTPVCGADGMCALCTPDAAGDSACIAHSDWGEAYPYCVEDGQGGTQCAMCRDSAHCPSGQVCQPESHVCGSCTAHVQCESRACVEGVCLSTQELMYVDHEFGDDNGPCTRDAPCASIDTALALIRAGDIRAVVLVAGGPETTYEGHLNIDVSSVTLLGLGAAITGDSPTMYDRPIVEVQSFARTVIEGLTITGARGDVGADGIFCHQNGELVLRRVDVVDNDNRGIDVDGCALTLERSLIARNGSGGVRVLDSAYTIRNNFIVDNGHPADSQFGGLYIQNFDRPSPEIFDFNTVVYNAANPFAGSATDLLCVSSAGMNGYGNILFGATGSPSVAFTGCALNYSNSEQQLAEGEGNISEQPEFVNAPQGDYRLNGEGPCVDIPGLVPAVDVSVDYDGEPRPHNGAYDMGADEFTP